MLSLVWTAGMWFEWLLVCCCGNVTAGFKLSVLLQPVLQRSGDGEKQVRGLATLEGSNSY